MAVDKFGAYFKNNTAKYLERGAISDKGVITWNHTKNIDVWFQEGSKNIAPIPENAGERFATITIQQNIGTVDSEKVRFEIDNVEWIIIDNKTSGFIGTIGAYEITLLKVNN